MQTSEITPSQAAVLELRQEKQIVLEAYDFLDEKRLLLAAELLRQLTQYERLMARYNEQRQLACNSIKASLSRHGLHGLQVYPPINVESSCVIEQRKFMGVTLDDTRLVSGEEITAIPPCNPSPEASASSTLFLQLANIAAELAGVSVNLHRLMHEYQRTERRARALENVVLPELETVLVNMTSQLEEASQEDAIRIHQRHDMAW